MNFENFLNTYNIDFLSSIDLDIHNLMLDKFQLIKDPKEEFVFFDIGCNAGSFIRMVNHKGINAKIHAFEPHPYLSAYLEQTYPEVVINKKCVSNTDGLININICEVSVGISSIIDRPIFNQLKNNQEIKPLEVESLKLDTYCNENGIEYIDFIKLDVEGAEYFVFEGAENLLKEKRIKCGQFEIGIDESGYTEQDIINLLEKYGYAIDKCCLNDYFFYQKN